MPAAKRNKQVFDGARPSQVCIPQQTESDEELDSDDDDVSPELPHKPSSPRDDSQLMPEPSRNH